MDIGQLSNQIILMFILMGVGVVINKLNFMSEATSNDLTNILLYIVSPCLIIQSFEQPYSATRLKQFALVLVGVSVLYLVCIVISHFTFSRVKNGELRRMATFGSIFSNAGFMGIPLASTLFGNDGVFFAVATLAAYNIFNWTYGISIYQKKNGSPRTTFKQQAMKALVNPNIIAILIGLLIFVMSIKLPGVIAKPATYISSLNTPLSMLVIGNSLAKSRFKRSDFSTAMVVGIGLRNLVFPLLAFGLLKLMTISDVSLLTSVLMAACPTAGLVVLFALQADDNPKYGIAMMTISTVLSLVTIPLVFFIISLV
ncbi:AEC family transporter [Fructilactobacillus vespulae]|uniref:AEC family transporter n=1 Tax=Fructilactobacillus vespulae TaxID=1249630 RepID=UPI0039B3F7FB